MDDGIPIVAPIVDLSQAPAINYKRTLAFINHFITHSVRFLNKFSCACEEKLSEIQVRVQRLEITLSILEAKLASIPLLDQVAAPAPYNTEEQTKCTAENAPVETAEPVPNASDQTVLAVSKDPRYAKFFKMVSVGVPKSAVKSKMTLENLNPDLLDIPDAPAPEFISGAADDSSSSSSDDFLSDDSSSMEDE